MDYGKMAQDMHDKVVSIRKDGGPGSGPRKGENYERGKIARQQIKPLKKETRKKETPQERKSELKRLIKFHKMLGGEVKKQSD